MQRTFLSNWQRRFAPVHLLFLSMIGLSGTTWMGCASPETKKTCLNDKAQYMSNFIPGDPCFTRESALNVEHTSTADKTISHNFGKNCMQCHQNNGPGRGLFLVAGSLYNKDGKPHVGGKVQLFSDPTRKQLVLELTSDPLGNFFTTQKGKLDYPATSYFVSVVSADGKTTKIMFGPKSSGACNQCHSSSFPVAF